MMLLLALFIEYFKIGLFAIGGGMATIPFLTKLADKTHWFTQMDLLNMIAVSESTPGPIGVNTATYVGFHIDGLTGMLSATIGLVTPSVIVVIAIYSVLKKFGQNHYVKSGMYGLRAASCGLIAAAGLLVAKVTLIDAAVWKETGNFFFRDFLIVKEILSVGLHADHKLCRFLLDLGILGRRQHDIQHRFAECHGHHKKYDQHKNYVYERRQIHPRLFFEFVKHIYLLNLRLLFARLLPSSGRSGKVLGGYLKLYSCIPRPRFEAL